MGYDDRREILERLEALERRLHSRRDDREGDRHRHRRDRDRREHDRDRDRGDEDFDEKRVIDTIVHCVSEQVGRMLEDQQARSRSQDDGGGEKRLVDLIVRLVSEHVQEIVATELDRRLGKSEATRDEERGLPPAPRGGAPDDEAV